MAAVFHVDVLRRHGSDKLDIFAVRNDGQMSTAAWDQHVADGAWKGWWRIG